jgi:xeroderma pigmentosum group C-complementing protein
LPSNPQYFEKFEHFEGLEDFRKAAQGMKGSRDFGAQLFTALLRSFGVETRLIFSLQPLGFNFGKLEDAHRLDRRKDDLDRDINEIPQEPARKQKGKKTSTKRKRTEESDDDEEDLGLPRVETKGMSRHLRDTNY